MLSGMCTEKVHLSSTYFHFTQNKNNTDKDVLLDSFVPPLKSKASCTVRWVFMHAAIFLPPLCTSIFSLRVIWKQLHADLRGSILLCHEDYNCCKWSSNGEANAANPTVNLPLSQWCYVDENNLTLAHINIQNQALFFSPWYIHKLSLKKKKRSFSGRHTDIVATPFKQL